MRGLCKEEDYAFLGMSEAKTKEMAKGAGVSEDGRTDGEDGRVRQKQPARVLAKPQEPHLIVVMFACVLGPRARKMGAAGKREAQRRRGE